jgi:hypothetical protein
MTKKESKNSDVATSKRVKREATDDSRNEECEDKKAAGTTVTPMKNQEGDYFFELSGKRRCTVRSWNKNILIDIREVSF